MSLDRRSHSGQGMVEYALILTLTSIVVSVILLTMGSSIKNLFSNIACDQGWSGDCVTSVIQRSPAPTTCPAPVAPAFIPDSTSTLIYTFTASDFAMRRQVLLGSIIRVLLPCGASYRSVSSTAVSPLLFGEGYAVFIAGSVGEAQITGALDHSEGSALWRIDVQVVAP